MNRCVYCAQNRGHKSVGTHPQLVRSLGHSKAGQWFIRSFSHTALVFHATFWQSFSQPYFTKLQGWGRQFSAFPQSSLLSLLFVYKKG